MIDGIMKAFFKFADITPEKGKEMVEGTYRVVQGIGNDMQSINQQLAEIKAHLGIADKPAETGAKDNAAPN